MEISSGNLTFHYPIKEHMLSELVGMLCDFQWKMMKQEANDGINSVMAICLALTVMTSASEENEVIKDFFLSSYFSARCLETIRRNDKNRAVE